MANNRPGENDKPHPRPHNRPNSGGKPDDPNGPQGPTGQPGGGTETSTTPPVSYLNEAQQARVDKLLGDKYDPTKPLNVQLFQARWAAATPEERRVIAGNLKDKFLEGGPTSKSLSGFHSEYMDILHEENSLHEQTLTRRIEEYNQNQGGFAQNQGEFDSNLQHWTDFANTAEGQKFIADHGYTQEEWLANVTAQMQNGLDQYTTESKKWAAIQHAQALLGQTVTGMVPPGWESTLASIRAGTAPVPSVAMLAKYPGIAADLVGINAISTTELRRNRNAAGLGANRGDNAASDASSTGATTGAPSTMPYQPMFSSDEIEADYI